MYVDYTSLLHCIDLLKSKYDRTAIEHCFKVYSTFTKLGKRTNKNRRRINRSCVLNHNSSDIFVSKCNSIIEWHSFDHPLLRTFNNNWWFSDTLVEFSVPQARWTPQAVLNWFIYSVVSTGSVPGILLSFLNWIDRALFKPILEIVFVLWGRIIELLDFLYKIKLLWDIIKVVVLADLVILYDIYVH